MAERWVMVGYGGKMWLKGGLWWEDVAERHRWARYFKKVAERALNAKNNF